MNKRLERFERLERLELDIPFALALSNSIAYQNIRGLDCLRRSPQTHFNVATKNRGGAHEKR